MPNKRIGLGLLDQSATFVRRVAGPRSIGLDLGSLPKMKDRHNVLMRKTASATLSLVCTC